MEYYSIFIPEKKPDFTIKSFYNDKAEALAVLKQHKEARMKAFSSTEEAVSFYLNGPSETYTKSATPSISSPKLKPIKSLFIAPTSQKLVAFRKLIEANNVGEVRATIQNPRYLVSSGDTPTILKEGPRYNALHIAAIEGRGEICRLILQTIESSAYIEKLHGQRTSSIDEVSAILLDLYLNTPDKCRSETPLHFASKHGSVEVVKELIAYPQCRISPNADGLFPRDIICSRAKAHNATPEIQEAIRVLLEDHYFVPLLRYEENVVPPTIGKPFSPTRPQGIVQALSPAISPRGEIKAYAGPMDRSMADTFYRRWKTPPRLVVVSPQLLQVRSEEAPRCHNSTPIKMGRRKLFTDVSLDRALLEIERFQEQEHENNNIDDSSDMVCEQDTSDLMLDDSSTDFTATKKGNLQQDNNGNHLTQAASTPMRLFHHYRIIENDMDSSMDSDATGNEANFSYLCDETRTMYDRSRLSETPSHKERSLRLTDIEKGLETVGRMLATQEKVGWKEYWPFLGKFCHLASSDGLQFFEEYLLERKQTSVQPAIQPMESAAKATITSEQPASKLLSNADNSINMLCSNMERFSMNDSASAAPKAAVAGENFGNLPNQQRAAPTQSNLSNPHLCVTSSLKVFATRFVNHLQDTSNGKPNGLNKSPFIDVVQKLDTMVQNFRSDAAFREIDFDKAHTLYAYLIKALTMHRIEGMDINMETVPKLERMLANGEVQVKGVMLGGVTAQNNIFSSLDCIKNTLKTFDSIPDAIKLADETESECRRLWQQESLITACNCRPQQMGINVAKRVMDRMKRREERVKRLTESFSQVNCDKEMEGAETAVVVDYKTYRVQPSTPAAADEDATKSDESDFSEDEDLYLSCSDTEGEEEQEDKNKTEDDDVFYTPPSSPTGRRLIADQPCDTNNNAQHHEEGMDDLAKNEESKRQAHVYITGNEVTKQDHEVWAVLEAVEIDERVYPQVFAWKSAMFEHLAIKNTDKAESKAQ